MRLSKEETEKLTDSILEMKEKISLCGFCFNPFQPFDSAQDRPFDSAQDRPFDSARDKPFDSAQDRPSKQLCPICSNPGRNKTLLCVTEKECDLAAIEKINKFKGLYFILGGTVSNLKKKSIEKLKMKELEERIKNPGGFGLKDADFQEIILATNPTAEGEATALYLERLLKPLNKKITRLGRGLPAGGELEYADEETLSSALEGRR